MKRVVDVATRAATYRYEAVAVCDGILVMVLEILGARIIAPAFGSSIFVWTAVIGVILAAMALGNWYGGRIADRGAGRDGVLLTVTLASGILLVCLLAQDWSLALAAALPGGTRVSALVAALLIFAPFNFLMGTLAPQLAKLKLNDLATAGSSVGRLYAAGATGSILGTFAAGYFLIAVFGSHTLGMLVVLGVVATSFIISVRRHLMLRLAVAAIAVVLLALPVARAEGVVADIDTAYARYIVLDQQQGISRLRLLITGNEGAQSGIILNQPEQPAFGYVQRFLEVAEAKPATPRRVLIIGGGTYTLPRLLAERYPDVRIDVVEIDGGLDRIARDYFDYRDDPRITIVHEDGRTYLNKNRQTYDLVYVDAFNSLSPPFQLTTTEAYAGMRRALVPDGILAANVISALQGDAAAFGESEVATMKAVFGQVIPYQVYPGVVATTGQNLMMLAARNPDEVTKTVDRLKLQRLSATTLTGGNPLSDDFAPVEHLTDRAN